MRAATVPAQKYGYLPINQKYEYENPTSQLTNYSPKISSYQHQTSNYMHQCLPRYIQPGPSSLSQTNNSGIYSNRISLCTSTSSAKNNRNNNEEDSG